MPSVSESPAPPALRLLDRAAIGLSTLCLLHCLALPVALVLIPWLIPAAVSDESVHFWLVLLAVPLSTLGLLLGRRRHGHDRPLLPAALGLTLLVLAATVMPEAGETPVTVAGAILVVVGHVGNQRLLACRR